MWEVSAQEHSISWLQSHMIEEKHSKDSDISGKLGLQLVNEIN